MSGRLGGFVAILLGGLTLAACGSAGALPGDAAPLPSDAVPLPRQLQVHGSSARPPNLAASSRTDKCSAI